MLEKRNLAYCWPFTGPVQLEVKGCMRFGKKQGQQALHQEFQPSSRT
jgi:hypothetical protein